MRAVLLRALPALLLLSILPRPAMAGVDRWTPLGPDGGEIWTLVADPDHPGTVYAGTYGSGVWKSSDGGGHWSPTPEGPGAFVGSLAVSSGRVWAAGSSGLFVLTEGAAGWRSVGAAPDGVYKVAVDPTNPDRIWVLGGSKGAVWRSEDAGGHWERLLHFRFGLADLAVAATTPPTVYAGGDGLYISTDTGATWRQASPFDAYLLVLDPEDAKTLYVRTSNGIWKTTDQGRTGSYLNPDFQPDPFLVLPGVLLGSRTGLWRSEDDGASWTQMPQLVNPIIRSMAADPFTPGGAWIGTEGLGVFRTLDGGRSWVPSRRGLGASDVFTFAFDPFQPNTFYTVNWAGLQRSVDAGASWSRLVAWPYLPITSLAADPRQPGLLYAGTSFRGLFVSRDRGAHWQRSLRNFDAPTVALDPLQPGVVYAAGTQLWRSSDSGSTWKLLPDKILPANVVVKIEFSPHHPDTLYLLDAGSSGNIFYPGSLSRSTDGGNTWKRLVRFGASSLAFDPRTPDLLYLGTATGAVRRSRDGGRTWEHVSYVYRDDDPFSSILTALLVDPEDPAVLYAGSSGRGVWRSKDQGVTWEPLGDGMIAPIITCLEADPRDRHHLIACTQGGGLLEIRLQS